MILCDRSPSAREATDWSSGQREHQRPQRKQIDCRDLLVAGNEVPDNETGDRFRKVNSSALSQLIFRLAMVARPWDFRTLASAATLILSVDKALAPFAAEPSDLLASRRSEYS